MNLLELKPKNPFVRQFIESYQIYEASKPILLRAIPNGRVEAWIISSGRIFYQVGEKPEIIRSKVNSFYPATSDFTTFYLEPPFKCLNIKFRLNLLGLDFFHNHTSHLTELSYQAFLTPKTLETIQQLLYSTSKLCVENLDRLMQNSLSKYSYDTKANIPLNVVNSASSPISIRQICQQMGMSTKTLERMTLKYFDLTPKKLYQITRFNNTIKDIAMSENSKISDALGCGYFDHSHFVKDCRNITSMSPKEFLAKLKLEVTDLYYAKSWEFEPEYLYGGFQRHTI